MPRLQPLFGQTSDSTDSTPTLYQSPPNSGGNDGAIPTVYVQNWPVFTNLTPSQRTAFMAMPQDLLFYARERRWLAETNSIVNISVALTNGTAPISINVFTDDRSKTLVIGLRQLADDGLLTSSVGFEDADQITRIIDAAGAKAIHVAIVTYVQSTFTAYAQIKTAVNGPSPTITKRSQIDAVYAAIAPTSVSATNPSPV